MTKPCSDQRFDTVTLPKTEKHGRTRSSLYVQLRHFQTLFASYLSQIQFP